VRTLVISDLHLGARLRHGVLRRSEPLQRLLDALPSVQRLVLLGDIIDLIEGRPEQTMREAEPVLRAIGTRLGGDREAVIVPGNHDRPLIASWLRSRDRAELTPSSTVPLDATPALARAASWLAPARVSVHYPGVWLSAGVWATHGHYLDRHLLPESAFGITRGPLGRLPRDGAAPIDYERARRPSLARASRWLPLPLATLLDDVAELGRAATMPRVPRLLHRRLLHRRMAPFTATLLGAQMSRASIPALARVVHRLGVDAQWVVFGHVHRLGPLAEDRAALWRGPGGRPGIVNTGSWVYEPLLVHRAAPPHPYWPGGAVLLEDDGAPVAIALLNDLGAGDLH
jgi:UDP-2,3-diacylglucosamine pyrophosphatase LpxH